MLSDAFFEASKDYICKVDLVEGEIAVLNALGQKIGLGHNFAQSFQAMIERSSWCLEQRFGKKGADDQIFYPDGSNMEVSLYEPRENGRGFTRIPKVHFSYWKQNPGEEKRIVLNVDFIPHRILNVMSSSQDMTANILICPDENETFECLQTRKVVNFLRGKDIGPVPPASLINTLLNMNRKPS